MNYVVRKKVENADKKRKGNNENSFIAKALRWCRIKQVYLMLFDILAANAAFFIGLWMRYDFVWSNIPAECITVYRRCLLSYSVLVMLVFQMLHLYKSIWRYASYNELHKLIVGNFITTVFHYLVVSVSAGYMPVSYFMIGPMLQFFFTVGIRFSYRFVYLMSHMRTKESKKVSSRNAMIIGAGSAGRILVRDILSSSETNLVPCCIIDDDPGKWGCFIDGIPVLGGRDDILINVEKYDIKQILFVIPTATAQQKRDILNICNETGCELKSLPGIYQLVNGEVSLTKMKDVAVEDLLGREPIRVNMDEIFESLGGKTILVTGGGGSIGSELCRQIAVQSPKRLIIFDVYENNAYDIEQELRRKIPDLNLTVLIGSVRDTRRINSVFAQYKPDIVYHAAAHKHVPLMETSPCEAIKNNVLGTYKTAYAALKYGCKRFVLISTDKAVNPTNIMGASKRLCEMVIQTMDAVSKAGRFEMLPNLRSYKEAPKNSTGRSANLRSISKDGNQSGKLKQNKTDFVAVRFGNVLGSNGSVVPLFKKQIENGGPVTVTHPDIIRYFMTIPEAVSLVLQAGTYAKGGEIFVLDMGAPVKIDTLARNLIKLSGHKIDEIRIVYTGLRPGEKLYEEKLMEEEGMKKTPNDLIHIGKPIPFDMEEFWEKLEKLTELSYSNSLKTIDMVADMVPTFHSAEEDLERSGDTFKELYEEAAEVKSKKHKRKANIASY